MAQNNTGQPTSMGRRLAEQVTGKGGPLDHARWEKAATTWRRPSRGNLYRLRPRGLIDVSPTTKGRRVDFWRTSLLLTFCRSQLVSWLWSMFCRAKGLSTWHAWDVRLVIWPQWPVTWTAAPGQNWGRQSDDNMGHIWTSDWRLRNLASPDQFQPQNASVVYSNKPHL